MIPETFFLLIHALCNSLPLNVGWTQWFTLQIKYVKNGRLSAISEIRLQGWGIQLVHSFFLSHLLTQIEASFHDVTVQWRDLPGKDLREAFSQQTVRFRHSVKQPTRIWILSKTWVSFTVNSSDKITSLTAEDSVDQTQISNKQKTWEMDVCCVELLCCWVLGDFIKLPSRTNTDGNSCSAFIYLFSEYILDVFVPVTISRRGEGNMTWPCPRHGPCPWETSLVKEINR